MQWKRGLKGTDIKKRIYEKFILKDSSIGCMIYEIYKTE